MKIENQLESVRKKLDAAPRQEWEKIAKAASVAPRHLYNIIKPDSNPHYSVVYSLYNVLNQQPAKRRAKRAEVQP